MCHEKFWGSDWLLRFNFNIIHVPGKNLLTAGALCLFPQCPQVPSKHWEQSAKCTSTALTGMCPVRLRSGQKQPALPSEQRRSRESCQNSKVQDFHKALMAYRATLLAQGSWPAQLMMGGRIGTPVPTPPKPVQPQWPNLHLFRQKDQEFSTSTNDHRTPLVTGQRVWINHAKAEGTVVRPATTPRSYKVETQERRNRSHLWVISFQPNQCSISDAKNKKTVMFLHRSMI